MYLELREVSKIYQSSRGAVEALGEVNLRAHQGEFVALLGPSGCGKSTLLRLVAGLIAPAHGEITFPGWSSRPKCRLIFQDHGLFPWMTVAENVAFGLEMEGMGKHERLDRANRQLSLMGMRKFAGYFPHELSGGMRQRAAIARAFVAEPDILLMDEPLRALDAQMRMVVQEELLRIWQQTRPLVLYVTHDIDEAILLSDRVLVMSGSPGQIREEISINLPRPRDLTGRAHPEIDEVKWRIWRMLEQEVRERLAQGVG